MTYETFCLNWKQTHTHSLSLIKCMDREDFSWMCVSRSLSSAHLWMTHSQKSLQFVLLLVSIGSKRSIEREKDQIRCNFAVGFRFLLQNREWRLNHRFSVFLFASAVGHSRSNHFAADDVEISLNFFPCHCHHHCDDRD